MAEHYFADIFNLTKNKKTFIIYNFDCKFKYLKKWITYNPDFLFTENIWIEYKGVHPNMDAYKLKRKFIIEYCINHKITFLEIQGRSNNWVVNDYYLFKRNIKYSNRELLKLLIQLDNKYQKTNK